MGENRKKKGIILLRRLVGVPMGSNWLKCKKSEQTNQLSVRRTWTIYFTKLNNKSLFQVFTRHGSRVLVPVEERKKEGKNSIATILAFLPTHRRRRGPLVVGCSRSTTNYNKGSSLHVSCSFSCFSYPSHFLPSFLLSTIAGLFQ